MIYWKNIYETGIRSIDNERKVLFLLLSNMSQKNMSKNKIIIKKIIDSSETFFKKAFENEIQIYKDLEISSHLIERQIREHNEFMELIQPTEDITGIYTVEFEKKFQNFIINHVIGLDLFVEKEIHHDTFYLNSIKNEEIKLLNLTEETKPLVKWSNIIQTGIYEIDFQHRVFVDFLNDIIMFYKIYDIEYIDYKLREFMFYAKRHMEGMKNFFEKSNIEKSIQIQHDKDVDKYIKNIDNARKDLKNKESNIEDIIESLILWLTDHIINFDKLTNQ